MLPLRICIAAWRLRIVRHDPLLQLALVLGDEGHSVTLVGPHDYVDEWDPEYSPTLHGRFEGRLLAVHTLAIEPWFMRIPVGYFEKVAEGGFDIILFESFGGVGHASVTAKHAGLALQNTSVGIIGTDLHRRRRETDEEPPSFDHLAIDHLERQAMEWADFTIFGDNGLQSWTERRGWRPHGATILSEPKADPRAWTDFLLKTKGHATVASETRAGGGPSLSVIVLHHERPALLRQALDGLAGQTFQDFETIIVDDGSQTSEALAALDEIEGAPRTCVFRQPNLYRGAARNFGASRAKGDILVFLDDDNIPQPTMLETLRIAMMETTADVVTCQLQFFISRTGLPTDENLTHRWAPWGGSVSLACVVNALGDTHAAYKRSLFDRHQFHEEREVGFEDWALLLQIVLAGGKLVALPVPLVWYRSEPERKPKATNSYKNARIIAQIVRAQVPEEMGDLLELIVMREAASS